MLKKYLIIFIVSLLFAFVSNRLYDTYCSPEALFYDKCLKTSENWANEHWRNNESCYVVAGGSEVRMNIDTAVMLKEHGIRAINAGLTAPHGVKCNVQIGLSILKKGDTFVLSVIPKNYNVENGISRRGCSACISRMGSKCFTHGIIPFNLTTARYLFVGSSQDFAMHIIRSMIGSDSLTRYGNRKIARVNESGRVEIIVQTYQLNKESANAQPQKNIRISGWNDLIRNIKRECQKKNANFVVYLSRRCSAESYKYEHAQMALHILELGVPVLRDPNLGVWYNEGFFSDSDLHLNVDAGREFSAYIAKLLKEKDYWTREELLRIIHQP